MRSIPTERRLTCGRGADSERGATMVEYGLLVALIAVVLIAAVAFFGSGVNSVFKKAGSSMSSSAGA